MLFSSRRYWEGGNRDGINYSIPSRTLGTWGLNSTALCMTSTAANSAALSPRRVAMSGLNLDRIQDVRIYWNPPLLIDYLSATVRAFMSAAV